MVEKIVREGKTVYLYTESEHRKAVEYENLSHKAIQMLEKLAGER